jgi:carbonic anhydrase
MLLSGSTKGAELLPTGQQYPMEIHLVHKDASTGNLAVVGIFFEEGAENPFLEKLGSTLPMENPVQASSQQIDLFHSVLEDNYRPIQSINGRNIAHFIQ